MVNFNQDYQLIYIHCNENKGKRDTIYKQLCQDCLVKGKCMIATERNRHKEKPEYGVYIKYYFIIIKKPCKKVMVDLRNLVKTKMIKNSTVLRMEYRSNPPYSLVLYTEKQKPHECWVS